MRAVPSEREGSPEDRAIILPSTGHGSSVHLHPCQPAFLVCLSRGISECLLFSSFSPLDIKKFEYLYILVGFWGFLYWKLPLTIHCPFFVGLLLFSYSFTGVVCVCVYAILNITNCFSVTFYICLWFLLLNNNNFDKNLSCPMLILWIMFLRFYLRSLSPICDKDTVLYFMLLALFLFYF